MAAPTDGAGGGVIRGVGGDIVVVRKTISPYDITSNDNPDLIITQVQLTGENYEEWARTVRTALRATKKFGFVDGLIQKPAEDLVDYEDWWTINSVLVSWIRNFIESTLSTTISHMEVARDLWESIRERFSVGNGARIQELTALAGCKEKGLTLLLTKLRKVSNVFVWKLLL